MINLLEMVKYGFGNSTILLICLAADCWCLFWEYFFKFFGYLVKYSFNVM